MNKPKLFTIVGTRPELIRLSRLIPKFDEEFDHVLIHTGQNFDEKLNGIFFAELGIRQPDYYLGINHMSLASTMGEILVKIESLINELKPQGVFILGDTNSSISAVIAKRMQIAVYHWEAGNRSFDENVPEETNRKIVDHTADFNIAYTNVAYRNLIREGIREERILLSGSPLKEVIDYYSPQIRESAVLKEMGLQPKQYFVGSFHRQENVDSRLRLTQIVRSLEFIYEKWNLPIIISTHPRTRAKLEEFNLFSNSNNLIFHEPFGYIDYMHLQINSKCVISDSGTISEECAIAKFPAITARDSMERPEALESESIVMTGLNPMSVIQGIEWAISKITHSPPPEYLEPAASDIVLMLVKDTIGDYENWSGVRKLQ